MTAADDETNSAETKTKPTHTAAILVAGSGRRFMTSFEEAERAGRVGESELNLLPPSKALYQVNGRPVFCFSLKRFASSPHIGRLAMVCPADLRDAFTNMVNPEHYNLPIEFLTGGASRPLSVRSAMTFFVGQCALSALAGEDKKRALEARVLFLHDGVRPFFDTTSIALLKDAALRTGAATLCRPVTDTIFNQASGTYVNRSQLKAIQTPQALRGDVVMEALDYLRHADEAQLESLTDETSLVRRLGHEVEYIEGSRFNRKLTFFEDIAEFEAIAKAHFS